MSGSYSLHNIAIQVQMKLVRKLIRMSMIERSAPFSNLIDPPAVAIFNILQEFISKQSGSEEKGKQVVEDIISVVTKCAVVYWNDLLSEEEEEIVLKIMGVEKNYVSCFLETAQNKEPGGFSQLVTYMGEFERTITSILTKRFSAKTVARAHNVCSYFQNEEVYREFFTNEEYANLKTDFVNLMACIPSNIETNMVLFDKQRKVQRRLINVRKMAADVEKKVAEKMAAKYKNKASPSTHPLFQESSIQSVCYIHHFIELESGDQRKADELVTSMFSIIAKLDGMFAYEVFEESQAPDFLKLIVLTRDIISMFLSIAQGNTSNSVHTLIEQHVQFEEHLVELMRPHFSGKTLDRIRSLVYYFKKPEVYAFMFSNLEDAELKADLLECLGDSVKVLNIDVQTIDVHSSSEIMKF